MFSLQLQTHAVARIKHTTLKARTAVQHHLAKKTQMLWIILENKFCSYATTDKPDSLPNVMSISISSLA